MIEHWSRMIFLKPGILDLIDVAIVAFIVYKVFMLVQGTRALQMMLGFVILVFAAYLTQLLRLEALNAIFQAGQLVWVIAILIVFQPELRSALARIGRTPCGSEETTIECSNRLTAVFSCPGELIKLVKTSPPFTWMAV